MGSIDTRLHTVEADTAYCYKWVEKMRLRQHEQDAELHELEARVAALESYINLLYRAQAARPAPLQPRCTLLGGPEQCIIATVGSEGCLSCRWWQPRGGGG